MHFDSPTAPSVDAATALTRDLPRDQALGLRLIALARAAAGMHLGLAALGPSSAGNDKPEHFPTDRAQLLRSQAHSLVESIAVTPDAFSGECDR